MDLRVEVFDDLGAGGDSAGTHDGLMEVGHGG